MKKRKFIIIISVLLLIIVGIVSCFVLLFALSGSGNPTGGRGPEKPYFITTVPTTVKNIVVPKGTKLIYDAHSKEGKQDEMMNEEILYMIELPKGTTFDWGGVPLIRINKFFNSEMIGYTVCADFSQLSPDKNTRFTKLWQSSANELGLLVKNPNDWSFNKNNIVDISSCGVNNQRYFKEDKQQQQFLDSLYYELQHQTGR